MLLRSCVQLAMLVTVAADPRNVQTGHVIPDESYCDQPYVVVLPDGTWLCTLTTGAGEEGATSQHVVSTRSGDQGKTWGPLTNIEPPGPPEASWVSPLLVPSGRVYAFYDYNSENLRSVKLSNGGETKRVDTLGEYVFKFSDDGGQTWSANRYTIPVREFEIDRENIYGGSVRFMWSVAKPLIHDGRAYVGLSKVGNFGKGFIERSEGVLLVSENILTESDPARITWQTYPDDDIGLRAPAGPIAEEQNFTFLSDGSLFCTYRTTQGHPCHAYSRDGGRSWTPPSYMTYAPGGRVFKHPRAANFVRRFSNGKYVYWFHNHAGTTYDGRNPVWLCGGVERDGAIHWSQPEILLYDDDPKLRMSYPDFIEDKGRYFVTETQKTVARVHEIPMALLTGLWGQFDAQQVETRDGLSVEYADAACAPGTNVDANPLPLLESGNGFTIECAFALAPQSTETTVIDARDTNGKGWSVSATPSGSVVFTASDGANTARFESAPGLVTGDTARRVSIIADAGPRILMFVVDGVLCDGGNARTEGWYRIDRALLDVNGNTQIAVSPFPDVRVESIRVYSRALRVSEVVGNHLAK
ncbi:MAG TPA: exo-alpha-sialidase [Candidatus Hydrogenedentes bacterium]|nr:exo-alpha-sialidase [Candidatus Hydrogenedentota bacterium]